MPICKSCGYWDETDADFDNSRNICDGCLDKAIADIKERGADEWTCGKYTVLSRGTREWCDECGSSLEEFIALAAGEFIKDKICSGCDGISIVDYLYPGSDPEPDPF